LSALAREIERVLTPVVVHIYDEVQRAAGLYMNDPRPLLPDLAEFGRLEASEFSYFHQRVIADAPFRRRDTRGMAANVAHARERALDWWRASLVGGDALERARAVVDGTALWGKVTAGRSRRAGRALICQIIVATPQPQIRLRPGKKLVDLAQPKVTYVVEATTTNGSVTLVVLRMTAGMIAVGLPPNQSVVTLVESVPNWGQRARDLATPRPHRFRQTWIHGGVPAPAITSQTPPSQLLATVEGARSA
jgi:hypothetical protein